MLSTSLEWMSEWWWGQWYPLFRSRHPFWCTSKTVSCFAEHLRKHTLSSTTDFRTSTSRLWSALSDILRQYLENRWSADPILGLLTAFTGPPVQKFCKLLAPQQWLDGSCTFQILRSFEERPFVKTLMGTRDKINTRSHDQFVRENQSH